MPSFPDFSLWHPLPQVLCGIWKKRKSKWNSNEFCFPALVLSFHTASQDPPRCYEASLSQAWETHIPSQSKLPSSMKTLWAQLGVFTRCLNGVPTANVYLGIASPPGSRHLLTATGIGIAAPGKWAPLFPTFCMNRSVLCRSRARLRRLQTKQTGCFSCVGLFPGGWKGAEELSLSCCNFSSLPSLPFPNYIISLEPHVFKKSLIHTPSQTLSNNVHASGCVLKGHTWQMHRVEGNPMVSPPGKHSSDSPSLTECSTSLLITVNEAFYDLGLAYVDRLISLCCYTGSSNSKQPMLPQTNFAILLLWVLAYAVPPALQPLLVHQGTVLPWFLGQQAPALGSSLLLHSLWVFLSPSALFLCPASYIYLCFTCLFLLSCFLAHLSPFLDCEIIEV